MAECSGESRLRIADCGLRQNSNFGVRIADYGLVIRPRFPRKAQRRQDKQPILITEFQNRVALCPCLLYTSPSPRD
eukprot:7028209-Alexandrium_andersonii.AAC.1